MSNYNLTPYINLIQSFLERRRSALEFKHAYLSMFKRDEATESRHQFEVLNEMFTDIDSFYPDAVLRDEGDLDEQQLRHRCELNLARLRIAA